jgi:histidinol-phosphatase
MTHESDLRLALRLADMSDELSMALFRSEHRAPTRKADGSPVTEADTSIERAVRDELARERRDDHVHGEEFGGERTGHRVWLIDPIDGTALFVEGGDQWATLIALVEDGDPVVGVVSRPATSTRWWASRGGGAFRNGRQIDVSSTTRMADGSTP